MAVHAAFGGSTNLFLHIPAIAFAAGLKRPTVDDWHEVNVKVPRLVSVLPNGPVYHPTGPRLSRRRRTRGHAPPAGVGLLDLSALTVTGEPLERGTRLVGKERAPEALRERLFEQDGVDPDDVIMSPARATSAG